MFVQNFKKVTKSVVCFSSALLCCPGLRVLFAPRLVLVAWTKVLFGQGWGPCKPHGPVTRSFFSCREWSLNPPICDRTDISRALLVALAACRNMALAWTKQPMRVIMDEHATGSPPAWKLALQQHSRASSRASSLTASPAASHRAVSVRARVAPEDRGRSDSWLAAARRGPGRDCDPAPADLSLVRELAVELLESIHAGAGAAQARAKSSRQGAAIMSVAAGAGSTGEQARLAAKQPATPRDAVLAATLSEAPTTAQSAAESPDGSKLVLSSKSSCPTSAASRPTSATLSERKRRTRRSSVTSSEAASGHSPLPITTEDERREIRSPAPAAFRRRQQRPKSATGRVQMDLGEQLSRMDWRLSPKNARPSTAMGHRQPERGSMGSPEWDSVACSPNSKALIPRSSRTGSPTRTQLAPGRRSYLQPSAAHLRRMTEARPSTPGHRDRFALSQRPPGPGAYTPVCFANAADHPTPPRTWMHDAKPVSELFWHLKESAMKPDLGIYEVTGDPGRKSQSMRHLSGRSTPGWVFGREARVCAIAGGSGFQSKHAQRHGDVITYDDLRMTVWRDWM